MQLLTTEALEQRVRSLVTLARAQYGISEGCSGREACGRLKIPLLFGVLPEGTDGLYSFENHTITVSSRLQWQPRIEFTIYHEIMHSLLEEDAILIEYFHDVLPRDLQERKKAIERCCHAGAAEFLAPRQRVLEAIATHGFSVDLIEVLSETHGISLPSAAIQVALCAPVECYVVICSHGPVPKRSQPIFHIDQASMSHSVKYPLARYAAVPQGHPLHTVWVTGEYLEEQTYVPFPSGKTGLSCLAQAKRISQRVVGILYRGHPPRKGQMGLPM